MYESSVLVAVNVVQWLEEESLDELAFALWREDREKIKMMEEERDKEKEEMLKEGEMTPRKTGRE